MSRKKKHCTRVRPNINRNRKNEPRKRQRDKCKHTHIALLKPTTLCKIQGKTRYNTNINTERKIHSIFTFPLVLIAHSIPHLWANPSSAGPHFTEMYLDKDPPNYQPRRQTNKGSSQGTWLAACSSVDGSIRSSNRGR